MDTEEEKYFVSLGMREKGGSFLKCIGEALLHADILNITKIKYTWYEYWNEYLKIGQEIDKNEC